MGVTITPFPKGMSGTATAFGNLERGYLAARDAAWRPAAAAARK